MTVLYTGQLAVKADGQGLIIPLTFGPAALPSNPDSLLIDVSQLTGPPLGDFGNILGVTVDCTGTNQAPMMGFITFVGTPITRYFNGGATQVFRGFGPCKQIILQAFGGFGGSWNTGNINVILWNYIPPNEFQMPSTITATIPGTVTVAGNVNVLSIGGLDLSNTFLNELPKIPQGTATISVALGAGTTNFSIPNPVPGVSRRIIRSMNIQAATMDNTGAGFAIFEIDIISGATTYFTSQVGIQNGTVLPFVLLTDMSNMSKLITPSASAISLKITVLSGAVAGGAAVSATIDYDVL